MLSIHHNIVAYILNNKMNNLVVVKICIVLSHILILVNITTAKKGLCDSASCRYAGCSDPGGVECLELPKECSAFFYDGVICTENFEINPRNSEKDLENIRLLIDLKGDDDEFHDVYVFYKHEDLIEFGDAIFIDNGEAEAQGVKKFIGDYPLKGLILDGIEFPITNKECDDFHKNFTAYIKTIKTVNPGLEIGFYLSAINLVDNILDMTSSEWFDFVKLNDVLDFYLIEFTTLNLCMDNILHGGITPIDWPGDDYIVTLNNFAESFEQCTIDKEKVYFEFLISPIANNELKDDYCPCEMSYDEYCGNRGKYESKWCVDTQDALYEKGKFAKKYSKGFVGRDIDLVDRGDKCKCDNKYITFYMMLRGYNNEDPLTCDAFK
ncbi:hypothetical protein QTP88_017614 [Uroleucon formosanum]